MAIFYYLFSIIISRWTMVLPYNMAEIIGIQSQGEEWWTIYREWSFLDCQL